MKLGCSSWSFHRSFEEGKIDQKKWIEKCTDELELDGVELLDFHFQRTVDSDIRKIKKLIIDKGLTISCVSVSNNFGVLNDGERRKEVEKVKKWTEAAYKYGAPVLRVFAGWQGAAPWDPSWQKPVEVVKEKIWPKMIECMKECTKHAENWGVVLVVENHDNRGLVSTAEDVLRIVKDVNSDWLMLNLDTGGYISQPNYSDIRKTVGLTPHVHAKFHDVDKEGRDLVLDYNKIFDILNKAKYRGFLSIEYEGKEEEFSAIPKVVKFLKQFIKR